MSLLIYIYTHNVLEYYSNILQQTYLIFRLSRLRAIGIIIYYIESLKRFFPQKVLRKSNNRMLNIIFYRKGDHNNSLVNVLLSHTFTVR